MKVIGGAQNNRQIGPRFSRSLSQFRAIHVRHVKVGEQCIPGVRVFNQRLKRISRIINDGRLRPCAFEDGGMCFRHAKIVIADENEPPGQIPIRYLNFGTGGNV